MHPCRLEYLCTDTDAQTRRLPGLCHSAAVTAAALRAPAQPQLLLRFTAIKVVCEFSKTRHLSFLGSPPPPSLFYPSLPFIPQKKQNKKTSGSVFTKLLGTRPPDLASAFYVNSSAAGPSLLAPPHPSCAQPLMCRRTSRTPLCLFSVSLFF